MAKSKKNKSKAGKKASKGNATTANTADASGTSNTTSNSSNNASTTTNTNDTKKEDLDQLNWLKECDIRRDADGEAFLQLEYQDEDELIILLKEFLAESAATKALVDDLYQIWQQTVLQTLLASSALWKKETVLSHDQRQMKDQLKTARYKINFIMHHAVGGMLSSTLTKWKHRRTDLLQLCYQTLQLLPRLAESCPHHKTDLRQCIIHFEAKEFLAAVACETWDTLYDYSIPIDAPRFIPILRRCAMLDILDKDWNMLGGWDDILKGLEAKCCLNASTGTSSSSSSMSMMGMGVGVVRLPCDALLHEHTTILRNARNSMQCKFFSVRFMRYTEDQAPQRWRYFPKCSAPACSHIETASHPHAFRCTSCWYFHYCSESCQEYCDTIMGLHPKFCTDTPVGKAALCRQETEQYLGIASYNNYDVNNSGSGSGRNKNGEHVKCDLICHACGMAETYVKDSMKRCSKCQFVYYCSRQCQEWDWRIGGHKSMCKKVASAMNNANSSNAAGAGGATENGIASSSAVGAAGAAVVENGIISDSTAVKIGTSSTNDATATATSTNGGVKELN